MSASPSKNLVDEADAQGKAPLLPIRHPNQDFFICDILDAIPKDDMGSMEHPIFSLATKPDTRTLSYAHNGVAVEITPSVKGLATIHDKDILIYCISQLIAGVNRGLEPKRTLYLQAYDMLVATNRDTSGTGYRRLREAFERLSGTRIVTNIRTNDEEITEGFGLVDSWRIVRRSSSGRMVSVKVTLSEWLYNAVLGKDILTISRDYFRLRKPIDRRIYELARKHCGRQTQWAIDLQILQKKVGSTGNLRKFRSTVSDLVQHDHLPEYHVEFSEDEKVLFVRREEYAVQAQIHELRPLDAEAFNEARIVAPGFDVYALEQEWRTFWVDSGKPELRNPEGAFINFCKRRAERQRLQ